MKNEEIHRGFSQSEIRDFLAQELRESQKEGGFVSVEYAEDQIKHFQKFEATKYLMTEKGWEDWDITDYILYDRETYFPFVGTEEERNKLLETLKKENTK